MRQVAPEREKLVDKILIFLQKKPPSLNPRVRKQSRGAKNGKRKDEDGLKLIFLAYFRSFE